MSGISEHGLASPDAVWRCQIVGARVGEPALVTIARSGPSTRMSSLTREVAGVISYTWNNRKMLMKSYLSNLARQLPVRFTHTRKPNMRRWV